MSELTRVVDFASVHTGLVFSAAFAPWGGLAATGDSDGRLVVWSLPSGTVKWQVQLDGAQGPVSIEQLVFARGTRTLHAAVTFYRDKFPAMEVRGWDVDSGREVTPVARVFRGWGRLAVSPDGSRAVLAMFSADSDGAQWIDLAEGKAIPLNARLLTSAPSSATMSIHRCVAWFSPDMTVVWVHFLCLPADRTTPSRWYRAKLDARSGEVLTCEPWGERASARAVPTMGDGRTVLRCSEEGGIELYAFCLGDPSRSSRWRIAETSLDGDLAVGPTLCALGTSRGDVRVYRDGAVLASTTLPNAPRVMSVAISPDEKHLLAAEQSGRVCMLSIPDPSAMRTVPPRAAAEPEAASPRFVKVPLVSREDGLWTGRLDAPWVPDARAWYVRVVTQAAREGLRTSISFTCMLGSWSRLPEVSLAPRPQRQPPLRPAQAPPPSDADDGEWFEVDTEAASWRDVLAEKTFALFLPPPWEPGAAAVELWARCEGAPTAIEGGALRSPGAPKPPRRMGLRVSDLAGVTMFFWPLTQGDNLIGREVHASFSADNLLSSRHALFTVYDRGVWVRDMESRNGVFVRIPRDSPHQLIDQDQFLLGRMILRFDHRPAPDREGWLQLVVGADADRATFPWPVPLTRATLGRGQADLSLPRARDVSPQHCELVVRDRRVVLSDLGSARGTFVRIRGVLPLSEDAELLLGNWLYTLCEMDEVAP